MQHYGFTSRPPKGAAVVEMMLGGSPNNRVTVAESSGGPTDQEAGEVEIFAASGQRIILRTNGDVVIIPKAGQRILLGSADAAACDPVVTKSELNSAISTVVAAYNSHVHSGIFTGPYNSGTTTAPLTTGYTVTGSPQASATKP
jgi:phage gp45-like